MQAPAAVAGPLVASDVHPYASFTVCEITSSNRHAEFSRLMVFIRDKASRLRGDAEVVLIRESMDASEYIGDGSFEQMDGFVAEHRRLANWASQDFFDVSNNLTICLRSEEIVLIHTEKRLALSLYKWLRSDNAPSIRFIDPATVRGAFLRGKAKGIWLTGTHQRVPTKADSKFLRGTNLQEAFNPFEDSSFSFETAKAEVESSDHHSLSGDVGVTASRAFIWIRQTLSYQELIEVAKSVEYLVRETQLNSSGIERPFEHLAVKIDDISVLSNAFDISIQDPSTLDPGLVSPDMMEASEILSQSFVEIEGDDDSPNFDISVGRRGSATSAVLRGRIRQNKKGGFGIVFGVKEQTDYQESKKIVDSLRNHPELVTVYYPGGCILRDETIWRENTEVAPFNGWEFHSFDGYDVASEKPDCKKPQHIHHLIGQDDDRSLFSWVARHYSSGWLTCDDGSGEICDFIHLAPDDTLTFIHVKAAHSDSGGRKIAVPPYEVVTSQAVKNLEAARARKIVARLQESPVDQPATWLNATRMPDRCGMIAAAAARKPTARNRVTIVQPHIRESVYESARKKGSGADFNRLRLLDYLLISTHLSVVELGADFVVMGSR